MYLDGTYFERNPMWHTKDSPWKAKHILRMIKKNDLRPRSICEVGCGAGEILNQLYLQMPEGVVFEGYEISPQAFDLCRHRKKERVQFHLKDLLEDEGAFFDVVLCIDVFEHVEDYFGFLRKLRLRGKYKLFHVPLQLSVQQLLRPSKMLKSREAIGHIQYFSKETALATLADTGYEILSYFYTGGSPQLAQSFKALLAIVPRKLMFTINKDIAVRILGGYSLMVLTK